MSRRRHVAVLTSTNDEAGRLADEGAAHGTVVTADEQTAGRGRGGRSWFSPANGNIYLSVIWRPIGSLERVPQLTLQAAVAVHRAVADLGGEPQLKWPNDVFVDGRKCAGVLSELRIGAHGPAVIVGIGLNVAAMPAETPDEVASVAGVVASEREAAIAHLMRRLDEAWSDFVRRGSFDRQAWLAAALTIGRDVTVTEPGAAESFEAVALDIDSTGCLVVLRNGVRHTVVAGDVVHHFAQSGETN
ncbi:MAG: BirA family biotin operon repressor/biotin-[acetyl-CoA-carboxylase] ligase [Myxococcota bacterium]|jgi:BirA family biotin operon repressor/biotin-[acetyl-CoA-carboxylase] ligase